MAKEKVMIRWFLEGHTLKSNGQFVTPPRLIKVYDDETCTFFTSKKANDYLKEFDLLFMEGADGDVQSSKKLFKLIGDKQSTNKKQS